VSRSSLLLGNGTLLAANAAPAGASAQVGLGSVWQYALPAPPGHWVAGAELCFEKRAPCDFQLEPSCVAATQPLLPTEEQTCSEEHYGRSVADLALGPLHDAFPFACAPGTFGRSTAVADQSGPSCSGVCPAGYYCAAGSVEPKPCLEGFFCGPGSPAPQPCSPGTYGAQTMLEDQSQCLRCPAGSYCTSGKRFPCRQGTFNPHPEQASALACEECQKHSSTDGVGATAQANCTCRNQFTQAEGENGTVVCMCAEGMGLVSTVDGERCEPCAQGTYKDALGNFKCAACEQLHATSFSLGATVAEDCVCETGYFMATENETTSSARVCLACESVHVVGFSGTNCTRAGLTLERLPIEAGYYRQSSTARYVRPCAAAEACLGGDLATDVQCADGHTGPFCSICLANCNPPPRA